jgi:hypothetical protein
LVFIFHVSPEDDEGKVEAAAAVLSKSSNSLLLVDNSGLKILHPKSDMLSTSGSNQPLRSAALLQNPSSRPKNQHTFGQHPRNKTCVCNSSDIFSLVAIERDPSKRSVCLFDCLLPTHLFHNTQHMRESTTNKGNGRSSARTNAEEGEEQVSPLVVLLRVF